MSRWIGEPPESHCIQHSRNRLLFSVHIRVDEKVNLVMSRDGGLQSLEVHGLMTLRVAEDKFTKVKVRVDNNDKKGAQLQVSAFDLWQWIWWLYTF